MLLPAKTRPRVGRGCREGDRDPFGGHSVEVAASRRTVSGGGVRKVCATTQ
jgi:hypothetical protein